MVAVERELPTGAAATETAGPDAGGDAIPLALRRQGGSPRQVLGLTLAGTLVLAMFTSRDLVSWLDRLGDGPLLVPLQQAAATWDGAMERLGCTGPSEALRAAVRRLLDWQWDAAP